MSITRTTLFPAGGEADQEDLATESQALNERIRQLAEAWDEAHPEGGVQTFSDIEAESRPITVESVDVLIVVDIIAGLLEQGFPIPLEARLCAHRLLVAEAEQAGLAV